MHRRKYFFFGASSTKTPSARLSQTSKKPMKRSMSLRIDILLIKYLLDWLLLTSFVLNYINLCYWVALQFHNFDYNSPILSNQQCAYSGFLKALTFFFQNMQFKLIERCFAKIPPPLLTMPMRQSLEESKIVKKVDISRFC